MSFFKILQNKFGKQTTTGEYIFSLNLNVFLIFIKSRNMQLKGMFYDVISESVIVKNDNTLVYLICNFFRLIYATMSITKLCVLMTNP